jgi:hypothetical protein
MIGQAKLFFCLQKPKRNQDKRDPLLPEPDGGENGPDKL